MTKKTSITRQNLAIKHLKKGVIALPTDTIYGLSCLPENIAAISKILDLKHRSAAHGLLLVAPFIEYFVPYVASAKLLLKMQKASRAATCPTTYLLPASENASFLLSGEAKTIALRLTDDALIMALCKGSNSALVSTSANISGKKCATTRLKLQVYFQDRLDFVIAPSFRQNHNKPSKIVNLLTNERLR